MHKLPHWIRWCGWRCGPPVGWGHCNYSVTPCLHRLENGLQTAPYTLVMSCPPHIIHFTLHKAQIDHIRILQYVCMYSAHTGNVCNWGEVCVHAWSWYFIAFSVAALLLQCAGGFGTSDYKTTFQQKEFRSDSVQVSEKSSKELTGFTREKTHDPISSRPLEAFTWDSQTMVRTCMYVRM